MLDCAFGIQTSQLAVLEVNQGNPLIVPRGRNTTKIDRETALVRIADKASLGRDVFRRGMKDATTHNRQLVLENTDELTIVRLRLTLGERSRP